MRYADQKSLCYYKSKGSNRGNIEIKTESQNVILLSHFSEKHLTIQLRLLLGPPQHTPLTQWHLTPWKFSSVWCYQDWNHPSWQENFSGTLTSVVIQLLSAFHLPFTSRSIFDIAVSCVLPITSPPPACPQSFCNGFLWPLLRRLLC